MEIIERIGNNPKLVTGVGSALVDILVQSDEEYLKKTGAVKGGMIYVEGETIEKMISLSERRPVIVPGGSACNTIIGISRLGGDSRFVGKRGSDERGDFFEKDLLKNGVEPHMLRSSSATGKVLSIITPDAQRSFLTYLGASSEISPGEIDEACFANTGIVHIEGYLVFNRDLLMAILESAKKAGAVVSLDLASHTVVDEHREFLQTQVMDLTDILIANEDEAASFTGVSDENKALEILSGKAEIAVVKLGKKGSLVSCSGKKFTIEAEIAENVVDTTGAGDLWNAGFLFGLAGGWSIKRAGRAASLCGYEVCRHPGTRISDEGWNRIRTKLNLSNQEA